MYKPHEWVILFIPIVTGFAASLICRIGKTAGATVSFRPPSWVFGIVWPILYILLGFSWIYAHREDKLNNIPYSILVGLLVAWIIVYGCLDRKNIGLWIISLSILAAVMCCIVGNTESRLLIAPLIVWLFFALLLSVIEKEKLQSAKTQLK